MICRIKRLKYTTLVMLLCGFVAAGSLSSCREANTKENTEERVLEEYPTEEGAAKAEHSEGEEFPGVEEQTDPVTDQQPKDSV